VRVGKGREGKRREEKRREEKRREEKRRVPSSKFRVPSSKFQVPALIFIRVTFRVQDISLGDYNFRTFSLSHLHTKFIRILI
jgi:hypothetical protein